MLIRRFAGRCLTWRIPCWGLRKKDIRAVVVRFGRIARKQKNFQTRPTRFQFNFLEAGG